MAYAVELKPRATKDLRRISPEQATRIADALEALADGLKGVECGGLTPLWKGAA